MENFVVNIGAHDGGDTREYLDQGFRVVAIEADPVKADALRRRFSQEIGDGRVAVEAVGVGDVYGSLPFYRALELGSSSFDANFANSTNAVEVEIKPLAEVIRPYGRPHLIKCDIEGLDYKALSTLTPEVMPDYISAELSGQPELLDLFLRFGFRRFKLIAQVCQTDSEEIYPHEVGWRLLRRLSRAVPGVRGAIRALPQNWRPKTEWDQEANIYLSGPWGENASGPWLSESQARAKLKRILEYADKGRAWFDLHGAR